MVPVVPTAGRPLVLELTVNFSFGVVVPIPTLPFASILTRSLPPVEYASVFAVGDHIPVSVSLVKVNAGEPVDPNVDAAKYEAVEVPVTVSVEVAVMPATERLPEMSALPWTARVAEGEVVPMPRLPALSIRILSEIF